MLAFMYHLVWQAHKYYIFRMRKSSSKVKFWELKENGIAISTWLATGHLTRTQLEVAFMRQKNLCCLQITPHLSGSSLHFSLLSIFRRLSHSYQKKIFDSYFSCTYFTCRQQKHPKKKKWKCHRLEFKIFIFYTILVCSLRILSMLPVSFWFFDH